MPPEREAFLCIGKDANELNTSTNVLSLMPHHSIHNQVLRKYIGEHNR